MGQWDPELRASAEARQASKQAESSDWQRQGTNEAARRSPWMVFGGKEGEEQKKSVESGVAR